MRTKKISMGNDGGNMVSNPDLAFILSWRAQNLDRMTLGTAEGVLAFDEHDRVIRAVDMPDLVRQIKQRNWIDYTSSQHQTKQTP